VGVYDAYTRLNLRYSQMAPVTMWEEKNTGTNLPAQIELYADTAAGHESTYKFLFMAKGGGSANKSYLFQETKAILNPDAMIRFLDEKLRSLGTAACPPVPPGHRHRRYQRRVRPQDSQVRERQVPRPAPDERGRRHRPRLPRPELEEKVLELTRQFGIGAQFGGKYFCHDVRVVRLPPPRGLPAHRHRRVLLGRPPGARQDHPRGRVHRAARDRPGPLPARPDPRRPRR
jgi:fumarate hydratase class I